VDWDANGLLDGLDGDAREARRKLLDMLHGDGIELDELRAAVAEDRLVLLPIEHALLSPPSHSARDVADAAGVPLELLLDWRRIIGTSVPDDLDDPIFSDEDVAAAKRTAAYLETGFELDELRDVLRVLANSMARSAEAVRRLFAESFLRPGDSEFDLASRYSEMARTLMPAVDADLDYLMRVHLREFVRSDALSLAERTTGRLPETVEVAIGFADIVGFTRLGTELPEVELGEIAGRLVELAEQHVRRPARVVKRIGDAVMVVSPEPRALLDAMLDLVAAVGDDERLPEVRAGIHWGRAVARMGDWYGGTVNLAARLTTRARPGSVLVTKELRDALGEAAQVYDVKEAGLKRLKGLEEPVPTLRVRRLSPR
jgi:adenylate cyclase